MMEENGLPKGWVETTLGENLSEIAMGPFGSNLKVDMFTKSGVPIIKGSNLLKDFVSGDFTFVSEEKANSLGKAIAFPNDLIITHRGTLGQVSLVPKNKYKRYVTSQSQLRLSVNPKKIYYRYLLYFFKSRTGQYELLKNASQVGVPAISTPTKSIKEVELIIPSNIQEQNAIASILTSFDDKIELLQAQNETLETIAQTIFKEWFGKYQVGDELPEGWRVGKLSKIANFLNGLALQKYPPIKGEESLPVIKIRELRQGITSNTDRANKHLDSKYIVNDGDILFSWSGSLEIVNWQNGKGALNQHLFKVTSETYPKWFYYYWILQHLNEFREIASDKATTMGHINRKHLELADVIIPDSTTLKYLDKLFTPLMEKTESNSQHIQTLQATRDTLLPKLMSGQLRVAEFQEQLSEVM